MLNFTLSIIFIIMFIIMMSIIGVSFVKNKKITRKKLFLVIIILSALLSGYLYKILGSSKQLRHYDLEKTIEKLGGMEIIIQKIRQRVAEHPEDKQGREILKKLLK